LYPTKHNNGNSKGHIPKRGERELQSSGS